MQMLPRSLFALACAATTGCGDLSPDAVAGVVPQQSTIAAAVAAAAERHGVPADLLLAAGHIETRWQTPEAGDGVGDDGEHAPAAKTRLGLRPDQLELLRGYTSEDASLTEDDAIAIDAFAAALSAAGDGRARSLLDWLPALAAVGAPQDAELGRDWALEVMRALARGFSDVADTGEVLLVVGGEVAPEDIEALEGIAHGDGIIFALAGTDSGEVDRWLPARTGHWHTGRSRAIDRIVIHTTEGSYDGAISWFRSANNPYKTSAHYVVRDRDGHITQMVRERDTAYHVGEFNPRSIGIEHEGFAGRGGFSDAMYRASARLVRDICLRRGIPMTRTYIVSHAELPGTHWDPGPHWNWTRFMDLVRSGSTPPPPAASTGRAVASDVNGDGKADVVTLHSNGTAYTYKGSASGALSGGAASFAGTMDDALFDGTGHLVIGAADVNGDKRADLVTAHDNGYVYTYFGQSSGGFSGSAQSFGGTFNLGVRDGVGHLPVGVADVTGDGKVDLVTLHSDGSAYVYPGRSNGTFGASAKSFNGTMHARLLEAAGHWPVGVADVTGDGRADLVTVHTNGNAYVYPGNANGTFAAAKASFAGTLDSAVADGTGHEPVGVADVNGDGRADLVTIFGGEVFAYMGSSSGALGAPARSFAGTLNSALFDGDGHHAAGLLDVNGDKRADLLTFHSDGNGYLYSAATNGVFGSRRTLFGGTLNASASDGAGHQSAAEAFWRRAGCASNGCL